MFRQTMRATAAALALAVGYAPAHAAPVLIDNFATTQTLQASGAGASDSSGVATGANAIGGFRFASITNTAGSTGVSALDVNNVNNPAQTAAYSNDTNTESALRMIWDGNSDATIDAAAGLGGVDLTDGGTNDRVRVLAKSDLGALSGAHGVVTIYSSATDFSSAMFGLPGLGTAAPFSMLDMIFASDFTIGGGTGANFASVNAIILDVTGPQSLDSQFDFIATNPPRQVPEPTTLALLGAGLIGIGGLRRRKKAQSNFRSRGITPDPSDRKTL